MLWLALTGLCATDCVAANGSDFSILFGRPEDAVIAVSALSREACEIYLQYAPEGDSGDFSSPVFTLEAGVPQTLEIKGLRPDTTYRYLCFRQTDSPDGFRAAISGSFQTARSPGGRFVFGVQGDSHPERAGKMFSPVLYRRTLESAAADNPDFYFMMGDDFSIERLIERNEVSQPAVDAVYAAQRPFAGIVGQSAALFLVNGNHEQAARYLVDGGDKNAAVFAANARNRYYPLPAPDGFYSGDTEQIKGVGLLRDYYAWTWGDALFVLIDPYWHSSVPVDNRAGSRDKQGGKTADRDLWQVTLGEAQYRWLEKTLRESKAKWKFVFAHHVLGTGRGGVEMAPFYEWGGADRDGTDAFKAHRPQWDKPIHALMRETHVTIFFQGHDHLYAHQTLDGVVYQTCPNPADNTYTAFNKDAYRAGDIRANSGHLRVGVSPEKVVVEYVLSVLPGDENPARKNGMVAHRYEIFPTGKTANP